MSTTRQHGDDPYPNTILSKTGGGVGGDNEPNLDEEESVSIGPISSGLLLSIYSPQQKLSSSGVFRVSHTKPSRHRVYQAFPVIRERFVESEDVLDAIVFPMVPGTEVGHSTPKSPFGLKSVLSSPLKTSEVNQPSTSDIDVALPAIREQSESWPAGSEPSLSEMELSFGEMSVDPKDVSFVASNVTSSQSSATSNGDPPLGWKGKKWVVSEHKILEMFRKCTECGTAIDPADLKVLRKATQISVEWTCLKDSKHTGKWSSCDNRRGLPESNLWLSAATFFTGATYTDIDEWADMLDLQFPKNNMFYSIQSTYLIPVIHSAYKNQHAKLMQRLREVKASGKAIELCGDARSDSPGHCAKYSTYSFQDSETKEIVHFELVQVSEANSSVEMEVIGLERGLHYMIHEAGLEIDVFTTDRSPSVRKIMREKFNQIHHEFDPWHVIKSLKKKLRAVSQRKSTECLRPWLKSICNHLYWACETCNQDYEECVRRWKSVLYHICGVHRWEEDDTQYTCYHQPMTEDEQRRKKWLQEDSHAFQTLKAVVMDKNILKDMTQLTLFRHTGSLENFHSSMLKYTPKRVHFRYTSMLGRTELAVMDHNENVGREVAKTATGRDRSRNSFSKSSDEWINKPIYTKTTQRFRDDLMQNVLARRDDTSVVYSEKVVQRTQENRLRDNIAKIRMPDPATLLEKRLSRGKAFK